MAEQGVEYFMSSEQQSALKNIKQQLLAEIYASLRVLACELDCSKTSLPRTYNDSPHFILISWSTLKAVKL